MARQTSAAKLKAKLEQTITGSSTETGPGAGQGTEAPAEAPTGDVGGDVENQNEAAGAATEQEREEPAGGPGRGLEGDGRARRLVVRVPAPVKRRVQRERRRTGESYTAIALGAYSAHADELPLVRPGPGGGRNPLRLPPRTAAAGGRRRRDVGAELVELPLYVYGAEREVLERAVAAGKALNLSDLLTRVLELALHGSRQRQA